MIPPPDPKEVARNVEAALAEDVGAGDLTAALIPEATWLRTAVIAREAAVVSGRPWFDAVYEALDPSVEIAWAVSDGAKVAADATLCRVEGPARSVLTGERAALNFLQLMSGTATVTAEYVAALGGAKTKLLDTRKTVPGLRAAQKYAVRCGGGYNHRLGLHDAMIIKENHIAAAGAIGAAVARAREVAAHREVAFVEVEVETLAELDEALASGATRIMLDDFALEDIERALALAAGRAELEVSGSVTLETLPALAATGVDYISVGGLTKHVRAIDLSMRFVD